jgi:hypothetical protein
MIATVLAALALSAPLTAPPCRPSQYGAKVGSVSPIRNKPRGRNAIRTGRTSSPVTLAEGDILCGGELVTNPLGSGARLIIGLPGGAEITLEPGKQASIPAPGFVTRGAALIGQFDRLFASDAYVPSQTRGSGGNEAAAVERVARVVPHWGPLLIAWPSTVPKGRWSVSISRGGRASVAQVTRPFARIDVGAYCPTGCLVEVAQADGRIVARRRVFPAAPSEVQSPRWLETADAGMVERALLGAWLATRLGDPAWIEQGQTLMWGAACAYPAVNEWLARQIKGLGMRDPCDYPALSFKPL